MREETYYSVRMRASRNAPHEQGGKHISGGERLITYSGLQEAVDGLLHKGFSHSRGIPDFMQIQLESVHEPIETIRPLLRLPSIKQTRRKKDKQSPASFCKRRGFLRT